MSDVRRIATYIACVLGALTLVRCTPDYPQHLPCGGLDECPPGQVCQGGYCNAAGCELPAPCDPTVATCEPSADVVCCEDHVQACGACGDGKQTCTADGQWGECMDATAAMDEMCNHLDDDCDGAIDEELDCAVPVPIGDVTVVPVGTTTNGGSDFNRHGPIVTIKTRYHFIDKQICADVTVTMKEDVLFGGLEATATVMDRCAMAERPIERIVTMDSVHEYIDTNIDLDNVPVQLGAGIAAIECFGNTVGNDLCGTPPSDCSRCWVRGLSPRVLYQ